MQSRYTNPEQALGKGITRYRYDKLPAGDKDHFMRCRKCGRYFDGRRLDQMIAHSFLDHDAGTLAARELRGIRGRPVRMRTFTVIPIDQKEAIDGAEFDRMRRASARSRRQPHANG